MAKTRAEIARETYRAAEKCCAVCCHRTHLLNKPGFPFGCKLTQETAYWWAVCDCFEVDDG